MATDNIGIDDLINDDGAGDVDHTNLLFDGYEKSGLVGSMLVAAPYISDPKFTKSVIYILEDDSNGTIGIRVNEVVGHVKLSDVEFDGTITKAAAQRIKKIASKKVTVIQGGPVNTGGLLVMSITKDQEREFDKHKKVNLYVGAARFFRELIDNGISISRFVLVRGIAIWEKQQVYSEIEKNMWFVVDPTVDYLFSQNKEYQDKWSSIIDMFNVHPNSQFVNYSGSD